jgi:hypothetical protein
MNGVIEGTNPNREKEQEKMQTKEKKNLTPPSKAETVRLVANIIGLIAAIIGLIIATISLVRTNEAREQISGQQSKINDLKQKSSQAVAADERERKQLTQKIDSLTNELEKLGRAVPPPVTPPPTETVAIDSPLDAAVVTGRQAFSGTCSGIENDDVLWIVVEPSGGNYHPQSGAIECADGQWRGSGQLGQNAPNADTNVRFAVHIVVVGPKTRSAYEQYLSTAAAQGYPGISNLEGGRIASTVKLIRNDRRAQQ